MKNWPTWSKVLLVALVVFSCLTVCCCLVFIGAIVYTQRIESNSTNNPGIDLPFIDEPTVEPTEIVFPSQESGNSQIGSTPEANNPLSVGAWETLKTLEQEEVPVNDLRELAQRLGGKSEIPASLPAPAQEPKVGSTKKFWVSNMDTDENFQLDATLVVVGKHCYFWVDNEASYSKGDVQALVDAFDNKIYETDRNFFGNENSPGVDNETRLYILYASNIGSSVAGYFSSADAVNPLAHPYSNAHEMFVMSADNAPLDDDYTFGVLAHEFQHMIHWNLDRNEESWLNEGFSELASYLNGYDVGSAAYEYASDPDIQLNYWPNIGDSYVHYGSSYLFVSYVLDRFGNDFTQALVKDTNNGMDSLQDVLQAQDIQNPNTGEKMTADEVYADWTVANFLNDASVADGQYAYTGGTDVPSFFAGETYLDCPVTWQPSQVSQYGADYVEFNCVGDYTLQFQGVNEVDLLPENAFSGDYAFWSNRGDESDMTLTREFDFSGVSGSILLDYQIWYELEENWDYAYLEVSEDGGNSWQIIQTPNGTDYNPQGNAYGWGWTGSSNGWQNEQIDLSDYSGKTVQIRFEYVTDAAVNENGLMVDDIKVDAAGYSTDFETDEGGWDGAGFVRIQTRLPQTFAVSVIQMGNHPNVQTYQLIDTQQLSVPISIGGGVDSVILVISGTTRFTTQPAVYRYQVTGP